MARSRLLRYTTENVRHRTRQYVCWRFTLLAALLIASGCMMLTERALAQQAPVPLGVVASSRQEVPPLDVPNAGGLGVFTVNAERTEISYDFRFIGPFTSEPQQAHIHLGGIGFNGPPVFFLCATDQIEPVPAPPGTQACPGIEGGRLRGRLRAANFIAQPDAGAATFREALELIIRGGGYLNIHTPENPDGEARGQMGQIGLGAILASRDETLPLIEPSEASGLAMLSMRPERRAIAYRLMLSGPFAGPVRDVHIYVGDASSTEQVIFNLCPVPTSETETCLPIEGGTLSGTLRDGDLVVQPTAGIRILADAIDALITGNAHIIVRTEDNPDGEILGPIEVAVSSMLSSDNAVPPVRVPTEATGSALMLLSRDQSAVTYSIDLNGQFTGNVREVQIRIAPPGETGPVAAFICARSSTNPPEGVPGNCPNEMGDTLEGNLTEDDFMADATMGPEDFEAFLQILVSGGMYLNVVTRRNEDGEIRGQIEPVQLMPDMPPDEPMSPTFSEIQETIFVPFCMCHTGANPPQGLVLNTDATYDLLVDEPSNQRPLLLRVEPGNPDDSYLIRKLEGGPNIIGAQMPRGGPPLPQETIDEVRAWIADGAMNN